MGIGNDKKTLAAKTEDKDKKEVDEKTEEVKKDPTLLTVEDVREHCRLLERSVISKESRSGLTHLTSILTCHFFNIFILGNAHLNWKSCLTFFFLRTSSGKCIMYC
jgi:hypothetical protein